MCRMQGKCSPSVAMCQSQPDKIWHCHLTKSAQQEYKKNTLSKLSMDVQAVRVLKQMSPSSLKAHSQTIQDKDLEQRGQNFQSILECPV